MGFNLSLTFSGYCLLMGCYCGCFFYLGSIKEKFSLFHVERETMEFVLCQVEVLVSFLGVREGLLSPEVGVEVLLIAYVM